MFNSIFIPNKINIKQRVSSSVTRGAEKAFVGQERSQKSQGEPQ